ncbi:hypothetical protein Q4Q54_14015 [Shewanella sp. SP2S2-4]|uniref:hypothetical protein n=1 Tax=Shewanella sp. SP2S2-4 TaxID=3063539 RepID=UPI002890D85C|nr:hypothetical protein [Shewanella sp. SP2S2-4]MDT3274599.1 hypothetical protein [Shewanella sp. SP2S2-4]
MDWDSVKNCFEDHGSLVDIYFEGMSSDRWINIFNWLRENENIESVDCYDPINDKNMDYLPIFTESEFDQKGFYCFVSIRVKDICVFFRFYDASELECDVSPKEIDSLQKLNFLLDILAEVKTVAAVSQYVICPENFKQGAFIINGKFVP